MGQGKTKLNPKLTNTAKDITNKLNVVTINKDLQLLILYYLGQGSVALVLIFLSDINQTCKNRFNYKDVLKPILELA